MQSIANVLFIVYVIIKEYNNVKTMIIRGIDRVKVKIFNIKEEMHFRRLVGYIAKAKADTSYYAEEEEESINSGDLNYKKERKIFESNFVEIEYVHLEEELEKLEEESIPITDSSILEEAIKSNIGNTELYKMLLEIAIASEAEKESEVS